MLNLKRASAPRDRPEARASSIALATLLVCHCGRAAEASEPSAATVGIPFTRSYSLDEIGVSRGASLGFDRIGRLAVFNGNEYVVLNDAAWINIVAPEPDLLLFWRSPPTQAAARFSAP